MSIEAVKETILQVLCVVREWDCLGAKWWEPHTRYAIIDPMLRALCWDTANPKQCHPEFPRSRTSTQRVDYALFADSIPKEICEGSKSPDIIIETKALGEPLEKAVPQLRGYVQSSPCIQEGYAVLTNGNSWWVYDLTKGGRFTDKRFPVVDILEGEVADSARLLDEHLGRHQWL